MIKKFKVFWTLNHAMSKTHGFRVGVEKISQCRRLVSTHAIPTADQTIDIMG
jgi:hypothetical protein